MEDSTQIRNVSIIEPICKYMDKTSTAKIGINLNKQNVNNSMLFVDEEECDHTNCNHGHEINYLGKRKFNNYKGRGRGRSRNRTYNNNNRSTQFRIRFRTKAQQKKFDKRTCYHCGLKGHVKSQCWKLHPNLRDKYFKDRRRRRNTFRNNTKNIKPQKGDLYLMGDNDQITVVASKSDMEEQHNNQYEVFCMEFKENEDFEFSSTDESVEEKFDEYIPDNDTNSNTNPISTIPEEINQEQEEKIEDEYQPETSTQDDSLEVFVSEYLCPRT